MSNKLVDINTITNKELNDLKLHSMICTTSGICIMKVPSGWIYDCWDMSTDNPKQGVFVPFKQYIQY